jgi:hypothetical protein
MPNSTPSLPQTAYTFASRAHTPPNKMVKLIVLYVQSMTLCVFSYFMLVYRLIFGSKLFITPLTSLIASPPKPLARPLHTSLFITCTPTTCLFVFLVVFATPTLHPLCLTNSRPGLVLVFFLVIHLIIWVITAWTLPLSVSSFLAMLFLTSLLSPCLAAASFAATYEVLDDVPSIVIPSVAPTHPYGAAVARALSTAFAGACALAGTSANASHAQHLWHICPSP